MLVSPPPHAGARPTIARAKIASSFCQRLRIGNPKQTNPGRIKAAISHSERACRSAPDAARALIVSVAVPLVVVEVSATDVGATEQEMFVVAVEGTAQVSWTVPVNPFDPLTVTVELPLWPTAAMVKVAGFATTPKPGDDENPVQEVTKVKASIEPRPLA